MMSGSDYEFDQKLIRGLIEDYDNDTVGSVLYEYTYEELLKETAAGKGGDIHNLMRACDLAGKDKSMLFWYMVEFLAQKKTSEKNGMFPRGFFLKRDQESLVEIFVRKLNYIHDTILVREGLLDGETKKSRIEKRELKNYLIRLFEKYNQGNKAVLLKVNKKLSQMAAGVVTDMYDGLIQSFIDYQITDVFLYNYGFVKKSSVFLKSANPRVHSFPSGLLCKCYREKTRFSEVFSSEYKEPKEIGKEKWLTLYNAYYSKEKDFFDYENIYMPLVVSEDGGTILCVLGNTLFKEANLTVEKELEEQPSPLPFMLSVIRYESGFDGLQYFVRGSYYSYIPWGEFDEPEDDAGSGYYRGRKKNYKDDRAFIIENLDKAGDDKKGASLVYDRFYSYMIKCIADNRNEEGYVFSTEQIK